jgi:hypothetical protein
MRYSEDHMKVSCVKHFTASAVYPDLFEYRLTVRAASVAARTGMELDVAAFIANAGVVAKITGLAAFDRICSGDLLHGQRVLLEEPAK